jgi:glycine/D-amino acid oxidase-like deaminating enzyme
MPHDGFPVLGYPEPVPNLYLALMHSGVTLAPLVGELAAMEIVDGARVQILDAYRPERFWRERPDGERGEHECGRGHGAF